VERSEWSTRHLIRNTAPRRLRPPLRPKRRALRAKARRIARLARQKVLARPGEPTRHDPSYLNGDSYKAFGTGATSGSLDLTSGDWSVRVQAIGRPNGGDAYVFAQSSVYHLTAP
jgi:hypothetical protein